MSEQTEMNFDVPVVDSFGDENGFPTHAHISLTRLGGCNYKMPVTYKGKSVYVNDPQEVDRVYRLNLAPFLAGDYQHRDSSWSIRKWDDRSEKTTESELNWQT